jgi:flagellar biosynthetic protein FliR
MLALAVQMAFPIIGVSLFLSLMFGLMAKAVPQMNVFIVGMPLKIVVLSVVLVLVLPIFLVLLEHSLGEVLLQLSDWLAMGVGA